MIRPRSDDRRHAEGRCLAEIGQIPIGSKRFARRVHRWRDSVREPALTAMLVTQAALVVLGAPYASAGYQQFFSLTFDVFRILIKS